MKSLAALLFLTGCMATDVDSVANQYGSVEDYLSYPNLRELVRVATLQEGFSPPDMSEVQIVFAPPQEVESVCANNAKACQNGGVILVSDVVPFMLECQGTPCAVSLDYVISHELVHFALPVRTFEHPPVFESVLSRVMEQL